MAWRRGDRVEHTEYGAGVVRDRQVLGRTVVAFDARPRLTRSVHESELRALVGDKDRTRQHDAVYLELQRKAHLAARATRPAAAPVAASVEKGAASTRPRVEQTAPPALDATASLDSKYARTARPAGFAAQPVHGPQAEPEPPPIADPLGSVDAWQTLEALRLGVVPARGVREYTIARDTELADVDTMLREGRGCRVLWGDYGAGKTHILEASEQLALERGYAVARVTLDPTEHGLQHPLRLYRAIAECVRTLDQAQPGIEHILDRLLESPAHAHADGAAASRFFSPYLFVARMGEPHLTATFCDYVRGEDVPVHGLNQCLQMLRWAGKPILALSDYRTYGRMYVHLVTTLATWCKDAGFAGLALFFDEVERVDALGSEDRRLALEVFRHYAAVMMEPTDLAFDAEALYRGGHDVHRALPLRFRPELPLIGMFALTPLADIVERYRSVAHSDRYSIWLSPMGQQNLGRLVQRVAALYSRAYPAAALANDALAQVEALVTRSLASGEDSFRNAVRATVFALDAARHGSLPTLSARSHSYA